MIGGVDPLSPTKGEHLRAAITCLAETNPPWPTRLRRSKRRLRHNQERSHLPHPSRQMCDPQRPLFVIIGADVATALPRGIRARKGERLRGKSYSYREGDTRKQHSHDCLPTFCWMYNHTTLSFNSVMAVTEWCLTNIAKLPEWLQTAKSEALADEIAPNELNILASCCAKMRLEGNRAGAMQGVVGFAHGIASP
jgi:hypothetical protein